MKVLNNIQEF